MLNKDIPRPNLNTFFKNIYSQSGEDGVIEEILNRIGNQTPLDMWCVEFGAWDGIYLSNTYNLIQNKKYSAVLIEGDKNKHHELMKNIPQNAVHKICRYVSFDGPDSLDEILSSTPIPINFDFLSIDIDGCDYYIFESLEKYKPKVICIEFNPSIPNDVDFIQKKDFSVNQGASPKSLIDLGRSKNYSLVASTTCNLFFVCDNFLDYVVGKNLINLDQIRNDDQQKCYLFVGYDGTILSNRKELKLLWHAITLKPEDFQYLPRLLRKNPPSYKLWQKFYFLGWRFMKSPKKALRVIIRKFIS